MKQKIFADAQGAASKLWKDVGTNNVKVYDVCDYSSKVMIQVHPPGLMAKWTHVSVAVSGNQATGHDWMVIVPYRVDSTKESNSKVYDIDPVLFVVDSDTGVPHCSGAVAYHQQFPGRTSTVAGYESVTIQQTVQDLRNVLTANCLPLDEAPSGVLEAMHHMVNKFGPRL